MINKKEDMTMNDALDCLANVLTEEDVVSAKILSRISSLLAKERINRNMTMSEFAKFLEIPESKYEKFECEYYDFTIGDLVKLSNKLGFKEKERKSH